ncbi:hypothetical protein HGP14_23815 [Rhizobium sp. P32RR-XVIII]|uniref:hypothetical protein n=1 Tax=Rhizobium sp. P32RR-XVIII TaxID=2726738 RepID=UPI001456AEF4|nr:hypothetical protein [Rhizobium sp. P32RR-XVIII]NLS06344.1 hypothetical protein [Rhizobium sp. P32RR-XVIII]
MSLFDLLSYTDEEIELVTSALSCWLKSNHVDPSSERGRAALSKAILLVRSGVASPDDILAELDRVGERPSASAFPAATIADRWSSRQQKGHLAAPMTTVAPPNRREIGEQLRPN